MGPAEFRWSWVTLTMTGVTALITSLQFVEPHLLLLLERTPDSLAHHQYWRLFTPLFVGDRVKAGGNHTTGRAPALRVGPEYLVRVGGF